MYVKIPQAPQHAASDGVLCPKCHKQDEVLEMLAQCNNDSANRRNLKQQTQKEDMYIQHKAKGQHSASHASTVQAMSQKHPADRENGTSDLPCHQRQYRWHYHMYKDKADVDRDFEASNKPFSKDENQSAFVFRSSFAGSTVLPLICSLLTRVCPRNSRSRIRTQQRLTFGRQADRHIPQET